MWQLSFKRRAICGLKNRTMVASEKTIRLGKSKQKTQTQVNTLSGHKASFSCPPNSLCGCVRAKKYWPMNKTEPLWRPKLTSLFLERLEELQPIDVAPEVGGETQAGKQAWIPFPVVAVKYHAELHLQGDQKRPSPEISAAGTAAQQDAKPVRNEDLEMGIVHNWTADSNRTTPANSQ